MSDSDTLFDPGVFLSNIIASGGFWLFSTEAVEWHFVMSGVLREFAGPDPAQWDKCGVLYSESTPLAIYVLSKEQVPIEVLMARLDIPRRVLRTANVIRLHALTGGSESPPPEPNVPYWGTA